MRIGVLGPLEVVRDGVDVTPRGQRARDVLALLVTRRGEVVPAPTVLDLVWDGAGGLTPAAVHTVMARLRRALGSGAVRTEDAGYRLDPGVALDEDDFADAIRRGRAAAGAGHAREAVAAYREAVASWRGPQPYAGVSDDLVVAERARLEEQRAAALEDLGQTLLDTATPEAADEALTIARGLMAGHPLRERPHQLAMLAAYRCGRQAEALQVFQDLRRRLRDELGIDPSPATASVHALVLDQDPTLHPPAPAPRATGLQAPPVPLTPTVGRESELAGVRALLGDGRRLVTLLGPGGVGKSRLLAEVGASLAADDVPVAYVDLAGAGAVGQAELAETVAHAFGLHGPGVDPVAALVEALRCTSVVALVDEAEWSARELGPLVARVLVVCPGVRVVVTSRSPLEVLGESRVLLPPLACPPPEAPIAELRAAPAVRLLVARLADHAPDLVLGDDDVVDLARLARRVDGLPLALEIVAGYAASRSVRELLALVESPLDVTAPDQGHPPRHRTLRETLLWSVERIDPVHRVVLRRLGVFAGAFDLAAARAVVGRVVVPSPDGATADTVEAAVRALVRDALVHVQREHGPGVERVRMRLLRTVRDLAVDELAASGELEATRVRHRRWFAARFRGQPLSDELVAEVGAAYDDYLDALRHAIADRDEHTLADLAITLARRWLFVEAPAPGLRWLDQVLATGVLSPRDRARLVVVRNALAQEESVAGADELDVDEAALVEDPEWLAMAGVVRSVHGYLRGDTAAAVAAAERVVQLGRGQAPHALAEGLGCLAVMYAADGRTAEAVAAADEAWALVGPAPSVTAAVSVVPKIALALTEADRPQQAYTVLTSVVQAVGTRLGLQPTVTLTVNVGWAALGTGRPAEAISWFTRGLHAPGRAAGGPWLGEAGAGVGCALAALARPEAGPLLELAEQLCRRHGFVPSPWQRRQIEAAWRAVRAAPDAVAQIPAGGPSAGARSASAGPAARQDDRAHLEEQVTRMVLDAAGADGRAGQVVSGR